MSAMKISKEASRYATKTIIRDSNAQTIGEAQKEYKKLIEDKPHQFSLKDRVTTLEQANQRANYFSEVDGHYPRGMSVCYTVGLSGDCGFSCPDFKEGVCENGEEMLKEVQNVQDSDDFSKEEIIEFMDLYGIKDTVSEKGLLDE